MTETPPVAPAVLIADDHPLCREALKLAARVLEAATLAQALTVAAGAAVLDLVLLDLRMSDSRGFAGLAQLHAERPGVPILVVTGVEDRDAAHRARRFGAVGFVPKSLPLPEIAAAIGRALDGQALTPPAGAVGAGRDEADLDEVARRISSLTPTQLRVLLGVLSGKLKKQIAYELAIAEATVKAHMTAILRKLNVLNRTQAALAVRALNGRRKPRWTTISPQPDARHPQAVLGDCCARAAPPPTGAGGPRSKIMLTIQGLRWGLCGLT